MHRKNAEALITKLIAAVWLINGLLCKLLDLVPRHQEIVARILGPGHARFFTVLIGVSEILMAAWIISRIFPRLNAVTQIIVVAVMNTIEYFLAPDLLLWGRLNAFFALLFIVLIAYNEFWLRKRVVLQE